jgi:hypothetical protein
MHGNRFQTSTESLISSLRKKKRKRKKRKRKGVREGTLKN